MDPKIQELKVVLERKEKEGLLSSFAKSVLDAVATSSSSIISELSKVVTSISGQLNAIKDSVGELGVKSDVVIEKIERINLEGTQSTKEIVNTTGLQLHEKLDLLEETIKKKDFRGKQGERGPIGEKGEKGEKGDRGDTGERGPRGMDGVVGRNGRDGKNGVDGKDGRDGSPDTPIEIKQKLEGLKGRNRLSASAIRGLDKYMGSGITTMLGGGQSASSSGDITAVNAGTGLAGGGTSGDVTLALDEAHTDSLYLRKDQNLADLDDWSVAVQSLRLGSNANGEGASLIETEDALDNYTATNVEGILAELPDKFLEVTQDLADLNDVAVARDNLGVYSEAEAQSNFVRKINNPTKDQGYEQNSSIDGVTSNYISDKTLHNIAVKGHPATKQTGSFWLDTTVTPSVLHIYANGATKDIKIDFTTANSELEHQPLEYPIDVWSGNSNQMGVNGLPLVQEYKASMGAYPVPILIDGGSF